MRSNQVLVDGPEHGQVGGAVAVVVAGHGDVAVLAPDHRRRGYAVRRYHVPLEGRNTATSVVPLPS